VAAASSHRHHPAKNRDKGERKNPETSCFIEKDWKDTLTAKYFLKDSEKTLFKYVLVRLFTDSKSGAIACMQGVGQSSGVAVQRRAWM